MRQQRNRPSAPQLRLIKIHNCDVTRATAWLCGPRTDNILRFRPFCPACTIELPTYDQPSRFKVVVGGVCLAPKKTRLVGSSLRFAVTSKRADSVGHQANWAEPRA